MNKKRYFSLRKFIGKEMYSENDYKKRSLTQMKNFALGVLGVAVLLLGIGLYYHCGWLIAFSEAAMVGGIADWFAVVALFRHPLGLPIPHTALIPKNKDSIGENLGSFVSEEFLIREKLEIKLDQFNVGKTISIWLSNEENANKIADIVVQNLIPGILKTINDAQINQFIQEQFQHKILEIDFGNWIEIGLEPLTKNGLQDKMLTSIFEVISAELITHKTVIHEKVKKATPLLTFGLADSKIAEGIFEGLYDFIQQAKAPESSVRKSIDHHISGYVTSLKESKETQQKLGQMLIDLSNSDQAQEYVNGIWTGIKRSIQDDLALHSDSKIRKSGAHLVQNFGNSLQNDPLMLDKINSFLKTDVLSVVLANKKLIGELISSTVKSWEANEVAEKLELNLGKDLQFIRINGTIVGGFVGLLLYFLVHFFK